MATMGVSKASLRGLRFNERIAKMREQAKALQKTVKVTPANDTMRKLLKHPRAGGFQKDGGAEWPNDRFTQRRIRDGDIKSDDGEHKSKPAHRKHEDNNAA